MNWEDVDVKKKIELLDKAKKKAIEELRKFVTDTLISLDERWELFHKSEFGDKKPYIERFDSVDLDRISDYWERHTTIYTEDLLETLIEHWEEDFQDDYSGESEYSDLEARLYADEKAKEFKEEVLRKFISSFEWDW